MQLCDWHRPIKHHRYSITVRSLLTGGGGATKMDGGGGGASKVLPLQEGGAENVLSNTDEDGEGDGP